MTINQLRHVADIRVSNVDKKSVDGQAHVRLVNYVDVYYNDEIDSGMEFMSATATVEQVRSFKLLAGDSIITKDSETAGDIAVPAFISSAEQDMVCGYHLAMLRPRPALVDPKFLFWCLKSSALRDQMAVRANGVTRFGLTYEAILGATVRVGPLPEQRRIADFLDDQVARIDNIVAAREKQARASQEEVSSIVRDDLRTLSRTNPLTPLRRHVTSTLTGSTPGPSMDTEPGIPWYTPASLTPTGEIQAPIRTLAADGDRAGGVVRFRKNSILMVGIGATAGRVALLDHEGAGNQQLTAILTRPANSPGFMFRQLQVRAHELLATAPFTTLPIINNDVLRRFQVVMPNGEVQDQLLKEWNRSYRALAGLLAGTHQFTALLTELKRSLITAAVTGQFDVTSADGSRVPV